MKTLRQLQLAPSILGADFAHLGQSVSQLEQGGAHLLHVDVMDGVFVPNLTIGPPVVAALAKATTLPLDCHLMVADPTLLVPLFAKAGAASITVHVESTHHLDRLLQLIREQGCKVGVSLNPATPLQMIELVLDQLDLVLIMSVNPGFGGQKMLPYCLDKVRRLREMRPDLDIQIDGGIKLDNIDLALEAGASNIVVGSAIFDADDVAGETAKFVEKLQHFSNRSV